MSAGGALAEPPLAPLGWVAVCGHGRSPGSSPRPMSFDSVEGRAHRLDGRHRRARRPRCAVATTVRRRHQGRARPQRARRWQSLKAASVDARGSTPYFGAAADGTRYFVKALGDDQRSADLLFRIYRWVQRKDLGDERPFSSLRRAVEHEAFVALAARDLGMLTPRVRRLRHRRAERATCSPTRRSRAGRSTGCRRSEVTDEVLGQVWRHLGAPARASASPTATCASPTSSSAADGRIWMIDFGFSEIAASDLLLANDVAELVASSSAVVGAERATAHAIASVDAAHARRRARAPAALGAERRVSHRAQGAARAARGPPGAPRSRVSAAGLAIAAFGALVLAASVRRRPRPGHPGMGAARVPRRQRPAGLAVRAAVAGRCSSATWPSARPPGWWWRGAPASCRWRIGVVLAAALKLVAERVIRQRDHRPTSRRASDRARARPGAILRGGDVPSSGWSFPSGHAVLIAAIALRRRAGPAHRLGAASPRPSRWA